MPSSVVRFGVDRPAGVGYRARDAVDRTLRNLSSYIVRTLT